MFLTRLSVHTCVLMKKNNNNLAKDGYRWAMAHYLEPYRIQDMDITSGGGSIENSPIYQNPYWPTRTQYASIKIIIRGNNFLYSKRDCV